MQSSFPETRQVVCCARPCGVGHFPQTAEAARWWWWRWRYQQQQPLVSPLRIQGCRRPATLLLLVLFIFPHARVCPRQQQPFLLYTPTILFFSSSREGREATPGAVVASTRSHDTRGRSRIQQTIGVGSASTTVLYADLL